MAATIKIKNSSTTGSVPSASNLVQGELAVNVTDLGLYTENASGTVVKLNAPSIDDKNTGATKHLTIDTSGNLGLGVTPSAWYSLAKIMQIGYAGALYANTGVTQFQVLNNTFINSSGNEIYLNNGYAQKYSLNNSGQFTWNIAGSGTAGNSISFTQAMTLDASGNLLVGTTTAREQLTVNSAGYFAGDFNNANAANGLYVSGNSGGVSQIRGYNTSGGVLAFYTNAAAGSGTERARITSGGLFKVVNSGSTIENSTGGVNEINTAANDTNTVFRNTASSLTGARAGIDVVYTASTPNGTTANFYNASDATAKRFEVRSNGGIGNYSANNVNLSDRREKTNFAPAGDYLAKICAIPVQTYNYIDQNLEEDDGLTLGVVAQDVQAVAPELVTESNWGSEEEPKIRLSIYQTDLQYALMKSIQELKAELDAAKARITALEA